MDKFERWYTQDLNQKVQPTFDLSCMFTGDNESALIGVHVTKGGSPATLSGTVSATVIRSNGTTVPLTGTLSGSDVSVVLTQACFNVPGKIDVSLTVTDEGQIITVGKISYRVEPTSAGTVVDPSGEITLQVADLVDSMEDAADAIEAATAAIPADYSALMASVAPTFSALTAYAAGDYVWYDGDLYQFTDAHAAGSWVGTDAEAAAICADVADLKSALNVLEPAATSEDVGKPLVAKTVTNGKVTEYEFGSEFSLTAKRSLINLLRNVAYINTNGAQYIDALIEALNIPHDWTDDYQPVTYISTSESVGTTGPYINTGVSIDATTKLTVDFMFTSVATSGSNKARLFGVAGGVGTTNSRFAFGVDAASNTDKWYCGIGNQNTWNGSNDTNRHTFIIDAPNKTFNVDNDSYEVAYSTFSTTGTFMLFGRLSANGYIQDRCDGRLYGATIEKDGATVMNLVPCYRRSDNVAGLYDTVSDTFFVNNGTGNFGVGDDVE